MLETFVRLMTFKFKRFLVGAFLLGILFFAFQSSHSPLMKKTDAGQTESPTLWPVQYWDTNSSSKVKKLPQAIVIGVKKCGTRALSKMITLNSAVASPEEEMHFFNSEDRYRMGLSEYRRRMPLTSPHQLTIETTPSYFFNKKCPQRIFSMNPKIKMLVILRDPSLRVVSDYTHESTRAIRFKQVPLRPFESLVMKDGEINREYNAVNISTYYYHMLKWLKYFPLENIHIVDGDELVKNPLPELNKVEKFLQLPYEITSSSFFFNATKGFYCWIRGGEEECLGTNKGRLHPQVDPAVMEKLIQFFHEPNKKFFELVGRTFNWR